MPHPREVHAMCLLGCILVVLCHPHPPVKAASTCFCSALQFWPRSAPAPRSHLARKPAPVLLGNCRHPKIGLVMQAREAVCGLWTFRFTVENEEQHATVWLEETGNMRPMNVSSSADSGSGGFGSVKPSAGRWSLKRSTVSMYYRKAGELAHSWAGRLVEERNADDSGPFPDFVGGAKQQLTVGAGTSITRSILDGVIQQGDSDPEFLGRFEAVQSLPAFTAEELAEMEAGRQRELVPCYAMSNLAGPWTLQGSLYEEPVILRPLLLHPNGTFEATPDAAHRFAGRWGLYRDGAEEALQENREQSSEQRGPRGEGTHLWLWAQRSQCAGFNMNADYRLLGRIAPLALDDQAQLSIAQTAADERLREEGRRGRGGEFAAPGGVRVSVKGMIFWGNIADMEYSDLAGSFTLQPLPPPEDPELEAQDRLGQSE